MSEPPSSLAASAGAAGPPRPPRRAFGQWLRSLLGARASEPSFRESLEELIEEHANGAAPNDAEEQTMFRNLLDFGRLDVADVMVPRADIVAVQADVSLDELIRLIREQGHSRLPVHRETLDDVVGMVHVRDVLAYWGSDKPFSVTGIIRPLLFVPPSMPVQDLLLEMRATKIHMALVIDEYGGTDGLVTIEDLVEEIVGEIEDEHDRAVGPKLVELDNGRIEADARVAVPELEALVGVDLLPDDRDEEIDTLGGLVFDLAGRVPGRGELVAHPSGMTFEVVEADARRIRRLRVHRAGAAEAGAEVSAESGRG